MPRPGNVANAIITFRLNEATGWAIVATLEELEKSGEINHDVIKFIEKGKELKEKYND